jgi:broad specificity phosphatase PhoE
MSVIYLVRHGQASFGASDYDRLSETGVRQSQILGTALQSRLPVVDVVWSGSMRRHRETAEACLSAMSRTTALQIDRGWDEYDHNEIVGVFEPRYRDRAALAAWLAERDDPGRAFQQMFSGAVARWVGGEHDGDYRETWTAFRARVAEAIAVLGRSLGKSETAVVFTSGGPIAAVCGSLLHVPHERQLQLSWTLANASVSKLLCRGETIWLSTFNDHSHLEGEHQRLITYR